MKKSVISDIFNGDRGHIETMKMTDDQQKLASIVSDLYDELEKKPSPELLMLHTEFMSAVEDSQFEDESSYFTEGFKLGLLIGVECMEE